MLERFPAQYHPDLIAGISQADDAAVLRLPGGAAIVLSVDFFPAIVDEPYDFGRIAAANAFSDIYAMGGRPLAALNIIGFPEGLLPLEALELLMRGGADTAAEAGAVIVGGHTVKDSELRYGLCVIGTIDPEQVVTTAGARPGDELVLTKPLGTGIYATAMKMEALAPGQEEPFIASMTALNAAAAEEMRPAGVHACTDITGFGLLGHALEMANASAATLVFDDAALPLLPRALELAAAGLVTGGGEANRRFASPSVRVEGRLAPGRESVLYDPQTSGGLLIAVPAGQGEPLAGRLRARGVDAATVVGEVLPAGEHPLVIRA